MYRLILIALSLLLLAGPLHARQMKKGEFLVLLYHAIPEKPKDEYSISRRDFVEHLEYLRTHGFTPVSLDDIIKASRGEATLPPKPVLLTFDDGYTSYHEFVVPLLEKFGYPSLVSISAEMIDNPPEGLSEPLMSWEQLKEVASNRLVEVISHTYGLHKGIQYNSVGNIGPALAVRAYFKEQKRYETEEEYIQRLEEDFQKQEEKFLTRLGFKPRVVVWPYGEYTQIAVEIARKRGYVATFTTIPGYADINNLYEVKRVFVFNRPMEEFIEMVDQTEKEEFIRAVQVDLDLIYDPESYEKTDQNLGRLIDRLVAMEVNTVFLQAFSDPEGTGNIRSVYFPNRVLPMKADLFSHAVHQIRIRGIKVYAWMPVLSVQLPDEGLTKSLQVLSRPGEKRSWYNRLSPFSEKVREIMRMLYEDLSAHCLIDGVLFQDDAYLTDFEDFHPEAIEKYRKDLGIDITRVDVRKDPETMRRWSRYKTEALIRFTRDLMDVVKRYRPEARFARNIYARVLTEPDSEEWFAQNYELFLRDYDYVVVMAYPEMEGARRTSEWLGELVEVVKGYRDGVRKTIFKLQAYDWQRQRWIESRHLLARLRDVLASGGVHIGYYPDNLWEDRPALEVIRLEMSTRRYPLLP